MSKFLKKHWHAITLTIAAFVIIHQEYNYMCCPNKLEPISAINPFFVVMSKWGIRFLLLSLLMTPLYNFTGWSFAVRLRKPLGLTAFLFVSVHVFLFAYDDGRFSGQFDWIARFTQLDFIIWGLIGFIILALMALTSFKFMMKRLGRWWKPLHRLVYGAGILGIVHGLLAATSGKRAAMGGEQSAVELRIYLFMLAILLVMRLPMVKHAMQVTSPFKHRKRKLKSKRRVSASTS